jgi:bifunctional UDP-N-acetylglucosamine pyrophosphorylase/glucosamine-1-phosphate N-acetyltransferase
VVNRRKDKSLDTPPEAIQKQIQTPMNTNVVILAAGLGTRMRSKRAKVLHRAGGLALVEHVVQAARVVTPAKNVVVVTGHQADSVEHLLAPLGVQFARQVEQKGTGHAVMCARDKLSDEGLLIVLYGDTPLLSAGTVKQLWEVQSRSTAAATLITTTLDDPTGYGRVIVDSAGDVLEIVEHNAANAEQLKVHLINSGIYCFRADLLWKHIGELRPDNAAIAHCRFNGTSWDQYACGTRQRRLHLAKTEGQGSHARWRHD